MTWSFGLPDDMVLDPGTRMGAGSRATEAVKEAAVIVGREANLTKLRDANMQW